MYSKSINQSNVRLNVLLARLRVIIAIIIRGIKFTTTSSKPIPLRNMFLESYIKNLTGFRYVKYCKTTGMSSIGEINPDSNTAGI
jgi:hypothetical protein